MIFGITLTAFTFIFLVTSIVAYYLFYLRKEDYIKKIARISFYSASALILLQSIILMYGIQNHYYDWYYVFSYSSNELSLYYLTSTFWAGQEGTFLLWLLYGSLYGIFIIRTQKEDEPLVMSFMSLIQGFITLILIRKNPFSYVWDIFPTQFTAGVVPLDGQGLNPLLQDPFMVIHPPILFIGYSSTMILFSFAMAALIRKRHDEWIKTAYPFSLLVALTLGTGIILGGYWAYSTLGWGGYWGWDPVENSSLVPWLTSLALFHGIMIQRRQGGMKKLNIFLALSTFMLVLYGSFLTRSGILTDFSVHSFGESELFEYLTGFLFLFCGMGIITYIFRIQGVKGEVLTTGFFTRELFMSFGMLFILMLTVFTFVGTSWPLITSFFMEKPQSIELSWYNKIAGPIAIIMGFLIALAPVLSWKRDNIEKLKDVSTHALITLALSVVVYWAGIRSAIPLLITMAAIFILLVNGQIVFNMIKQKSYAFGGYLAHVGIGLMLIGIITSSVYDESQRITLPKGEMKEIYGYELTYTGQQKEYNGKDKVLINVYDDETYGRYYWNEKSSGYMVSPSIVNTLLEDIYISPIQVLEGDTRTQANTIQLKKGTKTQYENYQFLFQSYESGAHNEQSEMQIFAVIDILDNYDKLISTIKPGIKMVNQNKEHIAAILPGTEQKIVIDGLNVENGTLFLGIDEPLAENNNQNKELLAVEVSRKPLINILWLGTFVLFFGFVTTIYNRSLIKKL